MTPKQTLWSHLEDGHGRSLRGARRNPAHHAPSKSWSHEKLQSWHARQHHRFATNHYHEGDQGDPDNRPAGWYTGEGAVAKLSKKQFR